jgi:hypothetical protein
VKPIPATPAILDIAPRIIWFESPQEALAQPIRFLAYAMTYARHEDMSEIRKHVSDADLREALEFAPPGIIDPRSWAYWNSKLGRHPAPPMPERTFGEAIRCKNERLDDLRRAGRDGWTALRESVDEVEPEEVRRKARTNWINRYGRKKHT